MPEPRYRGQCVTLLAFARRVIEQHAEAAAYHLACAMKANADGDVQEHRDCARRAAIEAQCAVAVQGFVDAHS